jgi:hypothetical protein
MRTLGEAMACLRRVFAPSGERAARGERVMMLLVIVVGAWLHPKIVI